MNKDAAAHYHDEKKSSYVLSSHLTYDRCKYKTQIC